MRGTDTDTDLVNSVGWVLKINYLSISSILKMANSVTRSNRTGQNNKRADRKVESNNSPEIPNGVDIRSARPSFGLKENGEI